MPKVGIGVYILNEKNQLLLMLEHWIETGNSWAPPGGKLEYNEEFLDCVKREVKEEVGLDVFGAELWAVNNGTLKPESGWATHYVNLDFLVAKYSGEPKIKEPHKCLEIGWFDLNNLPAPLLLSSENFFKHNPNCLCRSGKKYFDCHGKR